MRPLLLPSLLLTALSLWAAAPELDTTGIVSAADHRGGAVSPGEIVVLYPRNAGPAELVALAWDKDGHAFTQLGDTRVLFDGRPAPLVYAVSGEIGAVTPFEIAGRTSTSVVVEYQGKQSEPVQIPVVPARPALFTQNRVGTGEAGILNDTGCCNSEANPAEQGSWVTVYATGTGIYAQSLATGSTAAFQKPEDYPRPKLPVRLTVGGVPAELGYVAASPHTIAGLLQINFRVPERAPVGNAALVLSVGNAESTSLATMVVRSAKRRILLANFSAASQKTWSLRLKRAGYEVAAASDAASARKLSKVQPYDLAIVSLRPDSGEAWIADFAKDSPGMHMLVLSQTTDPGTLRQADLLGASAIVPAKAGSAAVLARVRELVRKRPNLYDSGPPWPFPTAAH